MTRWRRTQRTVRLRSKDVTNVRVRVNLPKRKTSCDPWRLFSLYDSRAVPHDRVARGIPRALLRTSRLR